ncbi:hypothetical protein [Horticoccus sp. 23ND18S-11]|uniref:hypothetical protein n=1 Tax=Horticoccus sp. 23ND18S-11 TaxID=3391832 RepID=UPI0039C8CD75
MNTLPRIHVDLRRNLCVSCPTRCAEYVAGKIEIQNAEASCPLKPPRWTANPRAPRTLGLGDAVAMMAQPITAAVDFVAGTDLKNCAGCGQRQAYLNNVVPDVLNPIRRRPKRRR